MDETAIRLEDCLYTLPPEWPDDVQPQIQKHLTARPHKVVVLDDDPTGTQTVHGIPVLTKWSVETLCTELMNDLPCVYLLTNTRSMPLSEAQALNQQIGHNLTKAAHQTQRSFVVVSRSDSTLRGHFPGEVDALVQSLEFDFDAWIVLPFFQEGGRWTINDIHYVNKDGWLFPVGITDFAQDPSFGYRASNLREWIDEKTNGCITPAQITSISLEDLRCGGPAHIAERLSQLPRDTMCVVNATSMRDIDVFVCGLLESEAQGRHYLYRTAASFVQSRAGIVPRPLLTASELSLPTHGGGLTIVGSFVPLTSDQVNELLIHTDSIAVEVDVAALISDQHQENEIARVVQIVEQGLLRGEDVVVFTSRQLITRKDTTDHLSIGKRVSASLCAILQSITIQPRYIIAKGGITSSDLATKGLGIKRAMVLGQIIPGVPVWQCAPRGYTNNLTYVVFPGNVGHAHSLTEVVTMLKR